MFVDEVRIFARSGSGGDGCVSFRREKFVPHGGPNGGNGGSGGNIYLIASNSVNNLNYLRFHPHIIAAKGSHGGGKSQTGRSAPDVIVKVPPGTVIKDYETGNIVADLRNEGDKYLAARGGRGGFGNEHYKSSVNQVPKIREFGEPGEEKSYKLELHLIADAGLVGKPNAGKSTLLSAVSNAHPKIADYPFTTLVPSVGVISLTDTESFTLADIPGLIEKAHEGKGLGIKFLKHLSRAKVLLYMIDISSENPKADFDMLREELFQYSSEFKAKPALVALSKADILSADELAARVKVLRNAFKPVRVIAISSVSGYNINKLNRQLMKEISAKQEAPVLNEEVVYEYKKEPDEIRIEKEGSRFLVFNKNIEKIAAMTDFSNPGALNYFLRKITRYNLTEKLKEYGITDGETIVIGENEFTYYS